MQGISARFISKYHLSTADLASLCGVAGLSLAVSETRPKAGNKARAARTDEIRRAGGIIAALGHRDQQSLYSLGILQGGFGALPIVKNTLFPIAKTR